MPTRELNSFSMTLWLTILHLVGCGHHSTDKPETTSPDNRAVHHRAGPLVVEVTGSDYQWHLRYPGADGRLGTPDDIHAVRHPHVPVQTETRFRLNSRDYLYKFAVPRLNLKEIAVPDLTFTLEFVVDETGEIEFRGDQFCGYSHPELSGTLFVESPKDFEAWLETM